MQSPPRKLSSSPFRFFFSPTAWCEWTPFRQRRQTTYLTHPSPEAPLPPFIRLDGELQPFAVDTPVFTFFASSASQSPVFCFLTGFHPTLPPVRLALFQVSLFSAIFFELSGLQQTAHVFHVYRFAPFRHLDRPCGKPFYPTPPILPWDGLRPRCRRLPLFFYTVPRCGPTLRSEYSRSRFPRNTNFRNSSIGLFFDATNWSFRNRAFPPSA